MRSALSRVAEAVAPEIGLAPACRALGVSRATAYRHRSPKPPPGPRDPMVWRVC
jgi:hypothetical protein